LEKFRAVFAKYSGLRIFRIVFLLKTHGIDLWLAVSVHGALVYDIVINLGLRLNLDGLDFMKSRSNPDHQSLLGRP
jgi:hypothetical protein